MKVSIGRAAKELGVTRDTLRRWEAAGRIDVERAPNGRRRYDLESLRHLVPAGSVSRGVTLAYARVPSASDEWELAQQVSLVESFCSVNHWVFQVCYDKGEGASGAFDGLHEVLRRIREGEVRRLVITHLDRIPRAISELVFSMCEYFGTEMVIINATDNKFANQDADVDMSAMISEFAKDLEIEKGYKVEVVR